MYIYTTQIILSHVWKEAKRSYLWLDCLLVYIVSDRSRFQWNVITIYFTTHLFKRSTLTPPFWLVRWEPLPLVKFIWRGREDVSKPCHEWHHEKEIKAQEDLLNRQSCRYYTRRNGVKLVTAEYQLSRDNQNDLDWHDTLWRAFLPWHLDCLPRNISICRWKRRSLPIWVMSAHGSVLLSFFSGYFHLKIIRILC